jgi:NAD(P)-dependent dehydrogenase (short-subunit alcohol dehydrogenase family)
LDRYVFVTGAGRRLGFEITKHLLQQGYGVIANYRTTAEHLLQLQADNPQYTKCLVLCQADLIKDFQRVEEVFQRLGERMAGCIHSASLFFQGNIFDDSVYQKMYAIHCDIPRRLTALFVEKGRSGFVIHLVDGNILRLNKKYQAYRTSKLFLEELIRQMAFAAAPDVRVNGIAPGTVLPPVSSGDDGYSAADSLAFSRHSVSVEDIIRGVGYLLHSPAVTGEILHIDGGVRCQ